MTRGQKSWLRRERWHRQELAAAPTMLRRLAVVVDWLKAEARRAETAVVEALIERLLGEVNHVREANRAQAAKSKEGTKP